LPANVSADGPTIYISHGPNTNDTILFSDNLEPGELQILLNLGL